MGKEQTELHDAIKPSKNKCRKKKYTGSRNVDKEQTSKFIFIQIENCETKVRG